MKCPAVLGPLVLAVGCTAMATSPPSPSSSSSSHATATATDVEVEAPPASPSPPAPCPSEMVLVDGNYCPNPSQVCRRWLDPPGPYLDYRCAEYAPSTCKGAREHKRFCIDREEYVEPGEALPLANQSWTSAKEVCEGLGKRLCLESEWQFACEGEEMLPYPYGYKRDATLCNVDRMDLGKPNGGLKDLRAPITDYPRCLSPFGVHDMSGNIEEWTTIDDGKPPQRSSMKGAWWLPGKNHCRARTVGHGEIYRGKQVGVRCCEDPR